MKYFLFFILFSLNNFANFQLRNTLVTLDDRTDQINIGLNSFPGQNEEIIQKWIKTSQSKNPFIVKIQHGSVAGQTKDSQAINSATIYVVNPTKMTGFLWWKKPKMHILKEPDWTLFIKDNKPLAASDSDELESLLQ